jgi:hypothetical protein
MVAAMGCFVVDLGSTAEVVVAAIGLVVVVAIGLVVVVGGILVAAIRADEVLQEPTGLVAGEVAEAEAEAVAGSGTGIQFLKQCKGCMARRCKERKRMGSFRRVELEFRDQEH